MASKKSGSKKNTPARHSAVEDFRLHFASLKHHMKHVEDQLEELHNLSTKLLDVGVAISSEINLFSLLTRIIDESKNLIKAQNGTLYLRDKKTNELYFHVVDVEQLKEVRIPIDNKSISGYVALTGKTLNILDVYEISRSEPYKFNKSIDKKTGLRTVSMITVPMISHEGEITGAVQLINKMKGNRVEAFSDRDEKILNSLASQAAVAIENAHLYKELAELFGAIVKFSAGAIDERDPATAGHSRRVAMYALGIARAMKVFSADELLELEYAAWLHDVGKIGVREHILNKQNKLYPDEMEKVRERFEAIKLSARAEASAKLLELHKHAAPEAKIKKAEKKLAAELKEADEALALIEKHNAPGYVSDEARAAIESVARKTYKDSSGAPRNYLTDKEAASLKIAYGNLTESEKQMMNAHVTSTRDMLDRIPFSQRLKNVPVIASSHHERNDGSGYPEGLKGSKILLQGRILAIADVYDALTAQDRPYKPAMPVSRALEILEADVKKGKLDKAAYKAFIDSKTYELEDPGK